MASVEWNPEKSVVTIEREAGLITAIKLMGEKNVNHLVVVDGEGLAQGILGSREVLASIQSGKYNSELKVKDVSRGLEAQLGDEASLEDAVLLFGDSEITSAVVLRAGKPVGIVTRYDLIQVMSAILGDKPEIGLLESSEAALADSPIARSLIKMLSDLGI